MFSAICSEMVSAQSYDTLEKFVNLAKNGRLKLSDLFPYHSDDKGNTSFYLPRPKIDFNTSIDTDDLKKTRSRLMNEKFLSKEKFFKITELKKIFEMLATGKNRIRGEIIEFTESSVTTKVNCRNGVSMPYFISSQTFKEGNGLYGIIELDISDIAEKEVILNQLQNFIELLGYSGIGGKRSSGYGKFELLDDILDVAEGDFYEDIAELNNMLTAEKATMYMSVSVLHPLESELSDVKKGWYSIKKRSGFSDNIKRNDIYMIEAGSCFQKKIIGNIIDISDKRINHPVYKYGAGMYVGLGI
jgi:CRISPR-associated protein Csm4